MQTPSEPALSQSLEGATSVPAPAQKPPQIDPFVRQPPPPSVAQQIMFDLMKPLAVMHEQITLEATRLESGSFLTVSGCFDELRPTLDTAWQRLNWFATEASRCDRNDILIEVRVRARVILSDMALWMTATQAKSTVTPGLLPAELPPRFVSDEVIAALKELLEIGQQLSMVWTEFECASATQAGPSPQPTVTPLSMKRVVVERIGKNKLRVCGFASGPGETCAVISGQSLTKLFRIVVKISNDRVVRGPVGWREIERAWCAESDWKGKFPKHSTLLRYAQRIGERFTEGVLGHLWRVDKLNGVTWIDGREDVLSRGDS